MKPVAISTLGERYLLSNYGTFFQHYALRKVLRNWGFSPFRVSHLSDRYEKKGFFQCWFKDVIRPIYWLLRMRPNLLMQSRRVFEADFLNLLFLSDYWKLVGRFREMQDFENAAVGIMGGDQILGSRSERDWLKDIPVGGKCITYAASSDWTERKVDVQWREFASRQFKRFSAIGIREQTGVDLCRWMAEDPSEVEHVADPVMLLDVKDYMSIASRRVVFKRPTLFGYFVNIRSKADLRIDEYVRLAELLGCDLRIAGIQGAEMLIPAEYRVRLSPTQFLRAMMDARYVVTNSYHGSVFAAIFKKNFLSVWQNCPAGTNQNERQKEFMVQIGLKDRWVDWRLNADQWYRLLMEPVNWPKVIDEKNVFRDKSAKWLEKSLKA